VTVDQTQHIVVYRSEQERAMDQFVMSGGPVPLMFGAAAFFAAFLLLIKGEQLYRRTRRPSLGERRHSAKDLTGLFLGVSAVVGVLISYITW
jgi:hypothetical protein